jgi:hypothetical protein
LRMSVAPRCVVITKKGTQCKRPSTSKRKGKCTQHSGKSTNRLRNVGLGVIGAYVFGGGLIQGTEAYFRVYEFVSKHWPEIIHFPSHHVNLFFNNCEVARAVPRAIVQPRPMKTEGKAKPKVTLAERRQIRVTNWFESLPEDVRTEVINEFGDEMISELFFVNRTEAD